MDDSKRKQFIQDLRRELPSSVQGLVEQRDNLREHIETLDCPRYKERLQNMINSLEFLISIKLELNNDERRNRVRQEN